MKPNVIYVSLLPLLFACASTATDAVLEDSFEPDAQMPMDASTSDLEDAEAPVPDAEVPLADAGAQPDSDVESEPCPVGFAGDACDVCDEHFVGDGCDGCAPGYELKGEACALNLPPGISLALWLDASQVDKLKFDDDSTVIAWSDRRGTGLTLTAPWPISQPTFIPDGRNKQGAIDFDGENDLLITDDFTGVSGKDFEVIFVGEPGHDTVGLLGAQIGGTDYGLSLDRDDRNFQVIYRKVPAKSGGVARLVERERPAAPMYIGAYHKSSAQDDRISIYASDGQNEPSNTLYFPEPSDGIGSPTHMRVGASQYGWLNGRVYEVLVYTRVLGKEERREITDYLRAKWNLP